MNLVNRSVRRASLAVALVLGAAAPSYAQSFKIDLGPPGDPAPDPSVTDVWGGSPEGVGVWNKRTGDPLDTTFSPLIDVAGVAHPGVGFSVTFHSRDMLLGGGAYVPANGNDLGGPYVAGDYAYACPSDAGDSIDIEFTGLQNGIYDVVIWPPAGNGAPAMIVPQEISSGAVSTDFLIPPYNSTVGMKMTVHDGHMEILGYQPNPAHLGASCVGLGAIQLGQRDVNNPTIIDSDVDFGLAFGAPSSDGAFSGVLWHPNFAEVGVWTRAGLGTTSLVDIFGNRNGLTVTITDPAGGTNLDPYAVATVPPDQNGFLIDDYRELLSDYISGTNGWTMTVGGLVAGSSYTLTLYAPATSSAAAFGNLTVNGVAQSTARFAPGWSFMQLAAAAASNGTITVTATPIGSTPTALAGLQIQPGSVVDTTLSCGPSWCRQGGSCYPGAYALLLPQVLCRNTACPDGVPPTLSRCWLPVDLYGNANCLIDPTIRPARHFGAPTRAQMSDADYIAAFNNHPRMPDGRACTDPTNGLPACGLAMSCVY
jgi:hypothetical protein